MKGMIRAKRQPSHGYLFLPQYTNAKGIVKQSRVWWWIYPKFNGGKAASTGHKTEEGAHAKVREWLNDLQIGVHDRPREQHTWAEAVPLLEKQWIADGSASMPQASKACLARLDKMFGSVPLSSITTQEIVNYIVACREKKLSNGTIAFDMKVLHHGLVVACVAKWIGGVPVFPIKPKAKVRRGLIDQGEPDMDDEWNALLEKMPPRYVPLLHFLDLTGWRKSEALNFRWSRVRFVKNGAYVILHDDDTKSDRPRELRVGDQLYALLLDQRAKRKGNEPYVFPNPSAPGKPLRSDMLGLAWRKACDEAQLEHADGSPILIHDIRRTWVVRADKQGVSDSRKMGWVGHEIIDTMRKYRILTESDTEKASTLAERSTKRLKIVRKTA